jgi:hypothetical protein
LVVADIISRVISSAFPPGGVNKKFSDDLGFQPGRLQPKHMLWVQKEKKLGTPVGGMQETFNGVFSQVAFFENISCAKPRAF